MKMLDKIRVIDLGAYVTGPLTAQILGDFGADVVKIERPGSGDPLRSYFGDDLYSPNFQSQNRNKRSMTLDIKSTEGLEILHDMVSKADVVILNNRPGVSEKLHIDYETLRNLNPRLIYCSITGFGRDGPYAQRPSFDNVGQAISGWGSRVQVSDDPRVASPLIADPTTAYFAAMGVIAALFDRERNGQGRLVEVNMLESMLAALVEPLTRYFVTGSVPSPMERAAISQAYNVTCQDGLRIGLHASALDKFFFAMCAAIGRPDLADQYPTRDSRVADYDEIAKQLAQVFRTRSRASWMPVLEKAGFPFAPQYHLDELEDDPQIEHLEVFEDVTDSRGKTTRLLRRPVWIDGSRDVGATAPPLVGEHSDQLLMEMGMAEEEIRVLREKGVI